MTMTVGKFTDEERVLFHKLEEAKAPIQKRLDELKSVIQADDSTNKQVKEARAEIFKVQKKLVPLSEMQAGLASSNSRDKYFPDLSKNAFTNYVKELLA